MKTNSCWKGYEMVGTKQKGKKTVPNCVQKKSAGRKQKIDGYLTQNKRVVRGKGKKGGFLPLFGLINSGIQSAASAIKTLIPQPAATAQQPGRIRRFRDEYNTTDKTPPPGSDMYAKFQSIMTDKNMSKENKDIELDNLIGSGMEFDDLMVGSGMAKPGFKMSNFLSGDTAKSILPNLATSALGTVGSLGIMELYRKFQEKRQQMKNEKMEGGAIGSNPPLLPKSAIPKLNEDYKRGNIMDNMNNMQNVLNNYLANTSKPTTSAAAEYNPSFSNAFNKKHTKTRAKENIYVDPNDMPMSFGNPQFNPTISSLKEESKSNRNLKDLNFQNKLKELQNIRKDNINKQGIRPTVNNRKTNKNIKKALAIGIPAGLLGVGALGTILGTTLNKQKEKEKEKEPEKYPDTQLPPTIMYGNGRRLRMPSNNRYLQIFPARPYF